MKKPRNKFQSVHFLIFCGILTSIFLLFAGQPRDFKLSAQPKQEEDIFYIASKTFPITIALDQIGILAKDGVSSGQMQEFVSRFQMKFLREYPRGIFIFGLPRPFDRLEIVKLGRKLRAESGKIVEQAGLVATAYKAEAPFIVTDEFIAQFKPDMVREQIVAFNKDNGVEIVRPDRFVQNQFLLQVTDKSRFDALSAANRYQESGLTEFAHPNFVRVIILRQFIPNDTLFVNQWHHQNTGQASGTVDADVDTPWAWTITLGAAGTIIAVIDNGFDIGHADLTPNLWINAGEIAGNGNDDDNNGFVDDRNGFDFFDNDGNPSPGTNDDHGTAVAGVVGARGNNALGVSGSCPNCSLMLIRYGSTVQDDADAFGYAQQMGAHIITNSWGYPVGTPNTTAVVNAINNAATSGNGGLGCVVFFAMNNANINDCIGTAPDISSLNNVIAVSASSNQDRKVTESAFGNCMDVLAPTHRGYGGTTPYTGTLNIATTDRTGNAGYNNTHPIGAACPSTEPASLPANARDYTLCFGGTSSAAPLTAGIAGLILTVNNTLTRLQVQRLLQDTADKIQDSTASYTNNSGFSTPATGVATHGWGRINAFEAVRIAAPVAQGGRGGVDIFLRDNRLDWGNTEQPSNTLFEPTRGFIGHWQSVDIKVDAPPYQAAPTATTFDAFTDEIPSAVSGDVNKVFVRVRNRGPVSASSVIVKLHWSQFGTALPSLPSDFWTAFPANSSNTSQWHPLNSSGTTSPTCTITNLAYSGSSVAGTAADAAQIASFDFPAPSIDASLPNHFCLLAMIESAQDPISPGSKAIFVVDSITPTDNNVTHRNYFDLRTGRTREFKDLFYVRNPFEKQVTTTLKFKAPKGWRINLDRLGFDKDLRLKSRQQILTTISLTSPELGAKGEITIIQEIFVENRKIIGGITYYLRPDDIKR